MSNKLNIQNIIVVNDFDYIQGGASKVAIETANILSTKLSNAKIYFFSAVSSETSNLNSNVIKICTNQIEVLKDKNKIRGFFNGIYNFKARRKLKKLLKGMDREKTVIHIHGWTKALSSSVFHIAFKLKYNIVLTMHDYFTACPNGGYYNYKKNEICYFKPLSLKCIKCNCDSRNYFFKLYRILRQFIQNGVVKLNKKLKNVISISDFSEDILRKTLNKNIKIYRVFNPIDLDIKPKKSNYKKNNYYLFVGRVSQEKGTDVFCQVISELNLSGIVVGNGNNLELLKQKYPKIEYVGWKNSGEVKEYMRNAKCLILPSRWYEGAPLTPLEAMQYGIPVITSDCNAARDYIINGKNGYIYSNYDELKESIKKIESSKRLECNFIYNHDYYKSIIKCYKNIL